MYVKPCPRCNRLPIIHECMPSRKDGTRRRMIRCPNYCSCLTPLRYVDDPQIEKTPADGINTHKAWYVFRGDGDNYAIYKIWNQYLLEKGKVYV